MEQVIPTPEQIEELTKLIHEANNVGSAAVAYSAQRVRVCVAVGERLAEWKKLIGHGHWEQFADTHWPDLDKTTRTRWQKLAAAKAAGRLDLDCVRGLRHAYMLAGILPDTDPKDGSKPSAKSGGYLMHIARLVSALQVIDLDRLNAGDRSTLILRLRPVVQIYERLTISSDSAGQPSPGKESF